jgi:predicted dehydrogenase
VSGPGPPVKIAVVGLGYWGPNFVRVLHSLPEASLELVCDLRPDAVAAVSERYPAVNTTTDYTRVLADESIEAVVIATQVETHAGLAAAALEAGKRPRGEAACDVGGGSRVAAGAGTGTA